jgi:hypothetical protein
MQSMLRYYMRDKLGAAISQSVKRRLGSWCEMTASLGVRQLEQEVNCETFAGQ